MHAPCESGFAEGIKLTRVGVERCANFRTGLAGHAGLQMRFGAGEGTRTLDINLGKVALYQLSYTRVREAENTRDARNVNGGFLKFSDINDGASRRLGSALGLEGD